MDELKNPVATFFAYDTYEAQDYAHLDDYKGLLSDIEGLLRSYLKYGHKFQDATEALESVKEFIVNARIERNISE